jgi:hypothetical protein
MAPAPREALHECLASDAKLGCHRRESPGPVGDISGAGARLNSVSAGSPFPEGHSTALLKLRKAIASLDSHRNQPYSPQLIEGATKGRAMSSEKYHISDSAHKIAVIETHLAKGLSSESSLAEISSPRFPHGASSDTAIKQRELLVK